MFHLFKRQPTASDIGRKGAAIRKRNVRQPIRDKCDEMRAAMGMAKAEWPE